jgi:hypothetical protein
VKIKVALTVIFERDEQRQKDFLDILSDKLNINDTGLYPASKVLSYFFSGRHGEARETLQNLCINSFEHSLLGC